MPAASFDTARRFEALARLGQALTASLDLPRVLEAIAIAFTPESLTQKVRHALDAVPATAGD